MLNRKTAPTAGATITVPDGWSWEHDAAERRAVVVDVVPEDDDCVAYAVVSHPDDAGRLDFVALSDLTGGAAIA